MIKYQSEILGATVFPVDKLVAFYGGIFSQWAECVINLKCLDLPEVNCAEQGMMLMKARTFGDTEAFDAILRTRHPSKQKAIGRQVRGFNSNVWDEVALEYVTKINIAKFSQNFMWGEALKLTYPFELVEASPTDKIWGVGMSEFDPDITDRSKWNGTNLLGKAIMDAREVLLHKSGNAASQ